MNTVARSLFEAAGQDAGRSVLVRQTLAGAVGGLLAFLFLEPARRLSGSPGGPFEGVRDLYLAGILVGGTVAACLICAEEEASGRPARLAGKTLGAALAGAFLGAGYSVLAHACYDALGGGSGLLGARVIARAAAWALLGLGVGLAAGIAACSGRRAYHGCAGGAIGGGLAGALFELTAPLLNAGTLRLLVALAVLGAAVGAATALADLLGCTAWVRVLGGSREGRILPLHRDPAVLGRDELADVPLFGDGSVERRHAEIVLTPGPFIRELATVPLLRVDGAPVREALLEDGSTIEIGRHRLRFHCRAAALRKGTPPPPSAVLFELLFGEGTGIAVPGSAGGEVEGKPVPGLPHAGADRSAPAVPAPAGALPPPLLLRVMGPGGVAIRLEGPPVTIGRETDNVLVLADPEVSRYHARIDAEESAWVLTDLESRNGTWVNGVRVRRVGLGAGDTVRMGKTLLGVEAAAPGGAGWPSDPTGSWRR